MFASLLLAAAAAGSAASAGASPVVAIDPGSWLTTDDYPGAPVITAQGGRVHVRMAVDATGRPTSCTVTNTSGLPVLDNHTCALMMRRGHFTPARDARGRAIAGSFTTTVSWTADPTALGPARMELIYPVAANGTLGPCRLMVSGKKVSEGEASLCDPQAMLELARESLPDPATAYQSLAIRVGVVEELPDSYEPAIAEEDTYLFGRAHAAVSADGIVTACTPDELDGPPSWQGLCQAMAQPGTNLMPGEKTKLDRVVVLTAKMVGLRR